MEPAAVVGSADQPDPGGQDRRRVGDSMPSAHQWCPGRAEGGGSETGCTYVKFDIC